jgi:hypothetical protein
MIVFVFKRNCARCAMLTYAVVSTKHQEVNRLEDYEPFLAIRNI